MRQSTAAGVFSVQQKFYDWMFLQIRYTCKNDKMKGNLYINIKRHIYDTVTEYATNFTFDNTS